jgi:hypothetical protein
MPCGTLRIAKRYKPFEKNVTGIDTRRTALKDSNALAHTYGQFVDLYKKSGQSDMILLKIVKDN